MAQRSESRLYSTLEVVRDDPFANAPQRDYSVVAPEVIHTYDEPEVILLATSLESMESPSNSLITGCHRSWSRAILR